MHLARTSLALLLVTLLCAATAFAQEYDEEGVAGPPVHVQVTLVDDAFLLQWEPPEENPETVTGYEIARAPTPSGPFRKLVHLPRYLLSFRDETANVRIRYVYKIRSQSGPYYSEYSSPASAEAEARER